MKWMAILASFLAGCLVVSLAGCGDSSNPEEKPRISGILVDIIAIPEDRSNTTLFLQFEDGRIAKCRSYYSDYIVFRKNVMNKVYIDRNNKITLVEIDDPAEKPEN